MVATRKAAWPYTSARELTGAGYRFDRNGLCRGPNCRAEILWFWTPEGKRMPLNPMTFQPHHSTCVDVDQFRKSKRG